MENVTEIQIVPEIDFKTQRHRLACKRYYNRNKQKFCCEPCNFYTHSTSLLKVHKTRIKHKLRTGILIDTSLEL